MNNNVNSKAKIVRDVRVENYSLGKFETNNNEPINTVQTQNVEGINYTNETVSNELLTKEIQELSFKLDQIQNQMMTLNNDSSMARELDNQIIQALRDLKNNAAFFEKATLQLESKVLKTSMTIAKKIIGVEVGEQSHEIARVTIDNMLHKIKTASQITIHLNPKDYLLLKDDLQLEAYVKIEEDGNVAAGGVVIASDLGNFDGNVDAKISSMLESFDSVL